MICICNSVSSSTRMILKLEFLHDTGHCYEKESREPPRGLQLLLGTKDQPHMVDTIVMANLGYWQLKAAPGVWTLALAPGRSTEIYTFSGKDEGTDKGPVSKRIIISDFRGLPVQTHVVKKRGMENEKILDIGGDEEDNRVKVFRALSHALHICEHYFNGQFKHLRLYFKKPRLVR